MHPFTDEQRAPVPVWLFSSTAAIEAFAKRASGIRTGHAEYDLFLVDVASVIEACGELSPGWIERNFVTVKVLLPRLHLYFIKQYPTLAGTSYEHLGHWLLRDAFPDRGGLPAEIIDLLRVDGFSGALALLAADSCLLMLHHWQSIGLQPTLEAKAAAMQTALTVYGRAAQALGFLNAVIPFEAKMTTSQACAHAQRASHAGFLELERVALEMWRSGLKAGRWQYGENGKKAPRGKGPRDAAKVITLELLPLAARVLSGKHAKRGIAGGDEEQVYRWILSDHGQTQNV